MPPSLNKPKAMKTTCHRPALDGIRVVDFTRVLAGPFATQTLGDLGAEVIKIEHPRDPDIFRKRKPQQLDEGLSFLALNRNKKSVVLDLSDPEHRAAALALICEADILVENYTSRVMRKYSLDFASIAPLHPRLIYCSVSAYGRAGSKADMPGYDGIAAAEAGVSWITVTADTDAKMSMGGLPFVDITAAMNATSAILAALFARERSGAGQHIDISLYDTALTNLTYLGYAALASGEEPKRMARQPLGGPAGYFSAFDGAIVMIVGNERDYHLMCDALERPDLAIDPRLQNFDGRSANLEYINSEIERTLKQKPRAYWVARLQAARIPSAPVLTAGEALASDFTDERGLVSWIDHPKLGKIPNLGSPLRFSQSTIAIPIAAPMLGQHSRDVLRDVLGYEDARIERICGAGTLPES